MTGKEFRMIRLFNTVSQSRITKAMGYKSHAANFAQNTPLYNQLLIPAEN